MRVGSKRPAAGVSVLAGVGLVVALGGAACGDDDGRGGGGGGGRDGGGGGADGGMDSGSGGGGDGGGGGGDAGGGGIQDAAPNLDAFFAADPPPMVCLPDGGMGPAPEPPGGTPECPEDKNREGCRCDEVGVEAPCWPGLRVDRNRGICRDGVTRCEPYDEFSGVWGACRGAVLPMEGARLGPQACNCFSRGRWEIDNLSPCFISYDGDVHALSTPAATGRCPTSIPPTPPPLPEGHWSGNRLTVDCEGQFRLCYTLKAGDPEVPPLEDDCTVVKVCVETWYEMANVVQELDVLPGWPAPGNPDVIPGTDPTCAAQFEATGGYGEMSVMGVSRECDAIDDGAGGEYVFNRLKYCPSDCEDRPDDPDCIACGMSGSGDF